MPNSLSSDSQNSVPPFTHEALNVKKRALEIELQNIKKKLSPKLKKKFQEVTEENVPAIFAGDKSVIELGGEVALVIRARTMIEKQIALYEGYLESMKKANKGTASHLHILTMSGWVYDAYTPAQTEERKKIQQVIKELEEESKSKEKLLEKALKTLGTLSICSLLRMF